MLYPVSRNVVQGGERKGVDTLHLLISTWRGLGLSMVEAKLRVLRSSRITAGVGGHTTAQIKGINKRLVSVLDLRDGGTR